MKIILVSFILVFLTGCSLNGVVRFGDDGSVSKPEVHGGVQVSGTRSE